MCVFVVWVSVYAHILVCVYMNLYMIVHAYYVQMPWEARVDRSCLP